MYIAVISNFESRKKLELYFMDMMSNTIWRILLFAKTDNKINLIVNIVYTM